jgi:hypothetical protein
MNEKLAEKHAKDFKAEVYKSLSKFVMPCYHCMPRASTMLTSSKSGHAIDRLNHMAGKANEYVQYESVDFATHFCSKCHTSTCGRCYSNDHSHHSQTTQMRNVE